MPPVYAPSRAAKLAAAARALKRARATTIAARRQSYRAGLGPSATRGFFGTYTKRGREELKVVENALAQAATTNTGTLVLYNGVAQGSDFTNRIGRKVIVKSIHFKWALTPATVTDSIGDIVRCMLVWDMQNNSATPAVTDILTTADILSGVNLNNRDRFKVLYDKRVVMNPASYTANVITGGNPVTTYREKYIKCNYETIFSGTGATSGSIATGALYLMFIDLNTTASTITHYARVRFSDA